MNSWSLVIYIRGAQAWGVPNVSRLWRFLLLLSVLMREAPVCLGAPACWICRRTSETWTTTPMIPRGTAGSISCGKIQSGASPLYTSLPKTWNRCLNHPSLSLSLSPSPSLFLSLCSLYMSFSFPLSFSLSISFWTLFSNIFLDKSLRSNIVRDWIA